MDKYHEIIVLIEMKCSLKLLKNHKLLKITKKNLRALV